MLFRRTVIPVIVLVFVLTVGLLPGMSFAADAVEDVSPVRFVQDDGGGIVAASISDLPVIDPDEFESWQITADSVYVAGAEAKGSPAVSVMHLVDQETLEWVPVDPGDYALAIRAYDTSSETTGAEYGVSVELPVGEYIAVVSVNSGQGEISRTVTFDVFDSYDLENAEVGVKKVLYDGSSLAGMDRFLSLTAKLSSTSSRGLSRGYEYQITNYEDSKGAVLDGEPTATGSYKASVRGVSPYHGEITVPFEVIDQVSMSDVRASALGDRYTDDRESILIATGDPVVPKLNCYYDDGAWVRDWLVEGEHYEIAGYKDSSQQELDGAPSEPGSYFVVVQGISPYFGTKDVPFTIEPATDIASGAWGTCDWVIDAYGTLTIYPGVGANIESYEDRPWNEYRSNIYSIVFAAENGNKVVAPSIFRYLCVPVGSTAVTSVDFSGIDTSQVIDMSHLFAGAWGLHQLDLSSFDTSNVTNMSGMFSGCAWLETVDLSSFDTSQVTDMSNMFEGLYSSGKFTSVDLSSFDTSNVTDMSHMFFRDIHLWEIKVGTGWSTANVAKSDDMFAESSRLRGGAGTMYDADHVDARYARIDSAEAPGYLTYKADSAKIDIANAVVTLVKSSSAYTGDPQAGVVKSVVLNGMTLTEGSDFTVVATTGIDVGSYAVVVTGKNDYEGTASATFAITPAPIDGAQLTVADQVYTGETLKPDVVVTLGSKQLESGVDYTTAFSDNVEPGTATVMVTGAGNYAGTVKATFAIAEPEASDKPDQEDKSSAPERSGSSAPSGGSIDAVAVEQTKVMHRLYNQWSGEHFYTADDEEYAGLVELGWTDEGTGWTAPESSNTPVFRMYNPYAGEHHYTMKADERDFMVEAGWVDEGIGWYSDDAQTVPLYREYNPFDFSNNHNYTTDKTEHDGLVTLGWLDEGYAWYGV